MTLSRGAEASDAPVVSSARSTLQAVAMPTEHGGWSLTHEPVLLGLIVAWSLPGVALGLAAMLAFLARTPLKLLLVDRWHGRWLERSSAAARVATVELLALVVLVGSGALGGDRRFWFPLLAAVAVAAAWSAGAVPIAAAIAIVVVAGFNIVAVRATPRPAKVIGLAADVLRHRGRRRHVRRSTGMNHCTPAGPVR